MLQARHQFAIETADCVAGQESGGARRQMVVDLFQVAEQRIVFVLLLLEQHQLQLGVDVLDQRGHLLVLHEQIVAARDVLHDVSLDLVVLENGQAVVDEDWRMGGLEVGAEVGRRLLHVDGGHLVVKGGGLSK